MGEGEPRRPKFNSKLPEVKLPEPKVKQPNLNPELPEVDLLKAKTEKIIKEHVIKGGEKGETKGEPGEKLPSVINGKPPKEFFEKKFEKKEDIPEAVKNFFEVRDKIEERWRKKMEKGEKMPEAVHDFFKQLDKIDERWQKKIKDKEGMPGAVRDFFKQRDKIEERWRKKMEKKEEIPQVIRDFFEQFPGRAAKVTEPPVEIHASAERREEKPVAEREEPERRVRRPSVRVEEEDTFGKAVGKKISAFERESMKKYELCIGEKTRVGKQMDRVQKDVMEGFALKYYIENRDRVEAANFKFNPANIEHVKMVVGRLGGYSEMNQYRPESPTGKEMPTYMEKLKQVESLQTDLYKEFVPPDSQALIFNLLQKGGERLKDKIGEAEGSAKKALKKEEKELFEVRKVLGKNTQKMFSGEEMKGFWKKTWENKLENLQMDLDMAIGFTEAKYAAVKDRVVTEFIVKDLKKDKKTGPRSEAIEGAFKGMGRDYIPFIDKIVHRRGLEGLTGGWEEDKRLLGDFLEAEGITDFSAERFDASKAALESRRMPYEKAVREQVGFLDWFLSFIFQSLSSPEAERR